MREIESPAESHDERLDQIIAEYLRRRKGCDGHLSPQSLVEAHPDFASELKEFIQDQAVLAGVANNIGVSSVDEAATLNSASENEDDSVATFLVPAGPVLEGERYRMLNFHAQGGMGEVWVADDARVGRRVAVKRLRRESGGQWERFRNEAQITGQLEHPGIVRLYDLDLTDQEDPYYVMQFVDGSTLKDAIENLYLPPDGRTKPQRPDASPTENRELDFHRLIEVFVDLCNTVGYAHSRGVLHRDLKPDNVMLGAFGETLVLDWGLSKVKGETDDTLVDESVRTSGGSGPTRAGSVMGTPAYMSPEAASGRTEEIDETSDIYLLGATLYEILTGRPPRTGSSYKELLELARSSNPAPPRTYNRSIPRALEAICLKAMARRKEHRYTTAIELADDMERFLAGEPVSAYRENSIERLARWARRHKRKLALACLFGIGAVATALGVMKWREANLLRAYQRSEVEIAEFRKLADQFQYLAAGVDPASAKIPYYDIEDGMSLATQALTTVDRWGPSLNQLRLPQHRLEQRQRLRRELYGLLLLLAQAQLQQTKAEQGTQRALAWLDRSSHLIEPTRGYHLLRATCLERLSRHEQAASARQSAQDANTPIMALDHFLMGEATRRRTWYFPHRIGSEDASAPDRETLLAIASEKFSLATDLDPQHYWAHLQRGRCLMALGRHADAIGAFTACLAIRPEAPWAYSERALAYALSRDFDNAMQDLDQELAADVDARPIRLNRGFVEFLRGNDDQALADFNWIMNLEEDLRLSAAAYYRSQIHVRRGDVDAARDDLDWIINDDPSFAQAYYSRSLLLFSATDPKAAIQDLDSFLRLTEDDYDPKTWQACLKRGSFAQEVLNDLPVQNAQLSQVLQQTAMKQLQHALRLGGQAPEIFANLATLQLQVDNAGQALETCNTGLDATPNSAELRILRAWMLVGSRPTMAHRDFAKAVELEPDNLEAHAGLSYALALMSDQLKAEKSAFASLLIDSQSEKGRDYLALYTVACTYGQLGVTDSDEKQRNLQISMQLLDRAISLWLSVDSPLSVDLNAWIQKDLRDPNGPFRSLQDRPEFQSLIARASAAK